MCRRVAEGRRDQETSRSHRIVQMETKRRIAEEAERQRARQCQRRKKVDRIKATNKHTQKEQKKKKVPKKALLANCGLVRVGYWCDELEKDERGRELAGK